MCQDKVVAGGLSPNRAAEVLATITGALVLANALGDTAEAAHATQMIEVIVGVDEVADRLVGEELVDLGDDRVGALVAQWPPAPLRQPQPESRAPDLSATDQHQQ